MVNTSEEQGILNDIGGILSTGGSEVTIVPEIQRQKFAKNFWNVAFSSYATLTRCVVSFNLKFRTLTACGPGTPSRLYSDPLLPTPRSPTNPTFPL